ncbi:unnamed protein product [Protopolystoma xenopodis]|uniref:Uncharacterized protein n=1 Tax=Protopolystoma xenopodis TaxID=117903 RepID=A0A3S5A6P8_9PLAT|nr:unnamed protein product [Protopolystoma xenopodis]
MIWSSPVWARAVCPSSLDSLRKLRTYSGLTRLSDGNSFCPLLHALVHFVTYLYTPIRLPLFTRGWTTGLQQQ